MVFLTVYLRARFALHSHRKAFRMATQAQVDQAISDLATSLTDLANAFAAEKTADQTAQNDANERTLTALTTMKATVDAILHPNPPAAA